MVTELTEYKFKYILQQPKAAPLPQTFSEENAAKVLAFHQQLPGYQATELVGLPQLASRWGLKNIFIKDESTRFNLKAFKVLGGSYAVARLLCQKLGINLEDTTFQHLISDEVRKKIGNITLTTATDGNHGRGIAWTAQQLRQKAVIYMPKGTVQSRVDNIKEHGATVEVTNLNYDDTVRLANSMAKKHGRYMMQDTSWEGYEDVPRWIMQGYMTMCKEATDQLEAKGSTPTHVFVQAGVGAMTGAAVGYLANRYKKNLPKFVIMEPNNAACIFASAAAGDGKPHAVTGDMQTIMAGLACGEPSLIGWDILRDLPTGYLSCDNYVSANGIRILANPLAGDHAVEAGESGSVGMGILDLLSNDTAFAGIKEALGLGSDSSVLMFNTEGATDPVNYREILWHGAYPSTKAAR